MNDITYVDRLRRSGCCAPHCCRHFTLCVINASHMLHDAVALIVPNIDPEWEVQLGVHPGALPRASRGRPWAEGYTALTRTRRRARYAFLRCLVRNCSNESGNHS
jgi:hypothetical protein